MEESLIFRLYPRRLWQPTDLGNALYSLYDAFDTSNLSFTSGTVTSFRDTTGKQLTLTNSTNGPTWSSKGIGNGGSLVFGNENQAMKNASWVKPSNSFSVFCVYQFNYLTQVGTNGECLYSLGDVTVSTGAHAHGGRRPATSNVDQFFTSTSSTTYLGPVLVGQTPGMVLQRYASSSPYNNLRVNGADVTVDNFGAAVSPATNGLIIGGNGGEGVNNYLFGKIGCILILKDSTDIDRLKVEGWAAHRWGIQSILPSTHPYKNNPPYTNRILDR